MLLLACALPDETAAPTADSAETGDTEVETTTLEADDARVRALTGLPEGDAPCAEAEIVRVIDASDGDTVWVEPDGGGEYFKVRMIGIDTPEIEHDEAAECYGDEAWDYTQQQLVGHLVWLTYDAECQDDYERTLAYVFRDDTDAGFFNRNLARNGYAYTMEIWPNNSFAALIEDDAAAAAAEGLGLWGACD